MTKQYFQSPYLGYKLNKCKRRVKELKIHTYGIYMKHSVKCEPSSAAILSQYPASLDLKLNEFAFFLGLILVRCKMVLYKIKFEHI